MNPNQAIRILALVSVMLPGALRAQTGAVSGVILAKDSGEPLSYGIVSVLGLDRSMFTTDSGIFAFHQLPAGRLVLHVRRLGFSPREVEVDITSGSIAAIRVELTRVALALDKLVVKAYPPCIAPGAPRPEVDSVLSAIVAQIRLNAEQYRFLAEQYPFSYNVVIARSSRKRSPGMVSPDPGAVDRYESRARRDYKAGSVVQRRGRAYFFQIPTLIDVADADFGRWHCWHFGGVETIDNERFARVDVVAFDSLKGPDGNGSFYVNRESFQIRRSVLNLSRRPSQLPELLAMETTTDFMEILPSIPIISRVYSVQTMDPERKSFFSEAYEEQRPTTFMFRGRRPGETIGPGAPRP